MRERRLRADSAPGIKRPVPARTGLSTYPRNRLWIPPEASITMKEIPRTYAEVDGLITMLQVACEDATINRTLQELLSQPNETRKRSVLDLAKMLRGKAAPSELVDAIVC